MSRKLQAVADAQNGDIQIEDLRIAVRGSLVVHAGRSAGENDAARGELGDTGRRQVMPHDLAEDVEIAHAPGDELRVLPAEVEDQDALFRHSWSSRGTNLR